MDARVSFICHFDLTGFFVIIDRIEHLANRLLPEGSLKEFLREQYRRRYNPFYPLVDLVDRIDYPADGSIVVTLKNGLKFCGPPDQITRRVFTYADRSRLGEIGDAGRWSTFLQILAEEFVGDIYGSTDLREGDVVVDVGAHTGAFTVRAALAVGHDGTVVALEPCNENFSLLQSNVRVNGLTNVVTVRRGVWSKNTRLTLRLSTVSGAHTFEGRRTDAVYTGRTEDVHVDTLDNILRDLAVSRVKFIKMDIEGAEVEALKGMVEVLRASDTRLAIAAYHRIDGVPTHIRIREQLRQLGYRSTLRNGIVYAQR